MKTKPLTFFAFFLLFSAFFSCKKTESDTSSINYPIEISYEEYSLEGTQCQWTNLPYNNEVIVINSNEELEKYITCTDGSYPAVDFAKQTLLLASGKADCEIFEVNISKLQQLSTSTYSLSADMVSYEKPITETWKKTVAVKKLNVQNTIELNTNMYMENKCNCIMDTLKGEWRWFMTRGSYGDSWKNRYTATIKILSQNEDGSINYEVYVKDTIYISPNPGSTETGYRRFFKEETLLCKESFQFIFYATYRLTDIKLPDQAYWKDEELYFRDFPLWGIFFVSDSGLTKSTIEFRWYGVDFQYYKYYYEKIKKH